MPSSASRDYGRPFAEMLAAYNHDFYHVDPLLFSPAEITFVNLDTGHSFRFGNVNDETPKSLERATNAAPSRSRDVPGRPSIVHRT